MGPDRSPGGHPIIRHRRPAPRKAGSGDPVFIDALDAHVSKYLGDPSGVWHEVTSPYVHVDVYVVAPTNERPVYTLVTSGMSHKPMGSGSVERRAELVMMLPASWPSPGDERFRQPAFIWPYQLLQRLARFPHQFDTILWSGHTVPNGDPPEPYAEGTSFCGALLAFPLLVPEAFEVLRVGHREIQFLGVIPLHRDEMRMKLDNGLDALLALLDDAEVSELLDPQRPSVVTRA